MDRGPWTVGRGPWTWTVDRCPPEAGEGAPSNVVPRCAGAGVWRFRGLRCTSTQARRWRGPFAAERQPDGSRGCERSEQPPERNARWCAASAAPDLRIASKPTRGFELADSHRVGLDTHSGAADAAQDPCRLHRGLLAVLAPPATIRPPLRGARRASARGRQLLPPRRMNRSQQDVHGIHRQADFDAFSSEFRGLQSA